MPLGPLSADDVNRRRPGRFRASGKCMVICRRDCSSGLWRAFRSFEDLRIESYHFTETDNTSERHKIVRYYDLGSITTEADFADLPEFTVLAVTHHDGQQLATFPTFGLTENRAQYEDREDDSDWFQGIPAKVPNKSMYLQQLGQARLRRYHSGLREHLEDKLEVAEEKDYIYGVLIERMDQNFSSQPLFLGGAFNRKSVRNGRICDENGLIYCPGPDDRRRCSSRSSINPYSSHTRRKFLTQWEFDHKITQAKIKSKILDQAKLLLDENPESEQFEDIMSEIKSLHTKLFDVSNLRFVCPFGCHEKGKRDSAGQNIQAMHSSFRAASGRNHSEVADRHVVDCAADANSYLQTEFRVKMIS